MVETRMTCSKNILPGGSFTMPILSIWLINKSGGLVFQKDFPLDAFSAPKLSTNDFLVLASTFQSVHAISTQLNPINSKTSGIESLEWHGFGGGGGGGRQHKSSDEATSSNGNVVNDDLMTVSSSPFKLTCFQSATGLKIILLTSPRQPQLDYILKRIYELYADYVMKNPFHTPEMPVRSEKFDFNLGKLVRQMSTNNYF